MLGSESSLLDGDFLLTVVVFLRWDRSREHIWNTCSHCWSLLERAAWVDFVFIVLVYVTRRLKRTWINLDWLKGDGQASLWLKTWLHNHSIQTALVAHFRAVLTAVFGRRELKVAYLLLLVRVFIQTEELIYGSEVFLEAGWVTKFLFTTSCWRVSWKWTLFSSW